jgi:hypothetical protein
MPRPALAAMSVDALLKLRDDINQILDNLWRKPTNPRTWLDLLKRYEPEGDLGEAKNKHLLPPPQSEELMELKLDDATEFVAALTGERHE